jgi:tetratricopeptide (TPR) repeat protein
MAPNKWKLRSKNYELINMKNSQQSPLEVPAGTGRRDQRWRVAVLCFVLAAITFAVFGQTLTHEFVNLDDAVYVYDNPMVARGLSMKGLAWVFTHADCSLYHPLTMLSLMGDYQLHGLHAGGYHLTNVLLHTASVILLFLILRQMTGALWRSAFVAAVFAIHPLRVESVAWVAERKDVLSGFFFMLTLGAYVRYVRNPNSPARYWMVAAAFVLALLSKPTVVTLPFVLLLLDYWPLNRFEQPRKLLGLILEKTPLLALAAGACAMTVLAEGKAIATLATVSMPLRLGNALVSYAVYLRQMVWPGGLAVFYPQLKKGYPVWTIAFSFLLLALITGGVLAFRRKRRWLLAGWLWYLGMLTPMIGIVQVGEFAHADRMTYLPQIGIYVALTWLVAEWGAKWQAGRVALGGLMTAVLAVFMVYAWKQTTYWKDGETLWKHTLACTTDNDADAHFNLGVALDQKGKEDEAIVHYQRALELKPGHAGLLNNLANILMHKGKVDEAIVDYQKALEIKPDYSEACNNLGNALRQKGNVDQAITLYQNALQIDPEDAFAHVNLGDTLLQKKNVDEAISHFQNALQIRPRLAQAHFSLGNAFREKGNVNEAIAQYQEALQIKPGYEEAHINLAIALLQAGRMDEAIVHCQKALEIKADDADARYNLGTALLQKGRMDEAIIHFQKALQINPDYVDAHVNLGVCLCQKGRMNEAIPHFQRALEIKPDNARAHNDLGNAFLQKGSVSDAIPQFQKALQTDPANPPIQNNLAWLLATCPDASLRNGNKAVELARQANALTGGENPIILHTLAAALAEAGRFSEAVETAQRALHLAGAQSNTTLAGQLQAEMKLYQAGMPFHSPAQTH